MALEIRVATSGDLEQLIPLVESYRQFYQQDADPAGARGGAIMVCSGRPRKACNHRM